MGATTASRYQSKRERSRSTLRGSGPTLLSMALAVLTATWSAAVVDQRLLAGTLPGPGNVIKILPYVMPALLFVTLFVRRGEFSWLDEWVTVWVILILLAVLLLPSLDRGSLTPMAIPAVALVAPIARRWPAASVGIVAAFSASFGSLQAFWNFPVEKSTALVLGGLWAASLAGVLFRGSRPARPSLAMLLFCSYILITAVMVPLASDTEVAKLGFKDSAWFMLVVPLIAYAGWGLDTHERIAKAILVVAVGASIYALFRVIAGPAAAETRLLSTTPYNFVDGKLKPAGSFDSAQSLGTWMSAVVPFAFAAILWLRGAWRGLAILATGLCTVAALESQLRVGLVGMIVGLLLVLVVYQGARGFPGIRLGTTLAVALVGVGLVITGLVVTGSTSTHSYSALLNPTKDPSVKEREYKWSQAFKDLDTHPFGYGVGSASYAEQVAGQTYFEAGDTNIDNGFLKVALEQGLVIMGLFAIALAGLLVALIRGGFQLTDRRRAGIAIGAAGTMASFLVVMMAEDATYSLRSLATWMIVGVGMAIVVSRRTDGAQKPGVPPTVKIAAEPAGNPNL